jgi:hypothetical protein
MELSIVKLERLPSESAARSYPDRKERLAGLGSNSCAASPL